MPIENAFTHTGIFLTWCVFNDLISEEIADDFDDEINQLNNRTITGGRFFRLRICIMRAILALNTTIMLITAEL